MTTLNLIWTNYNPHPERICEMCRPMIGTIWTPGTEPPLPLHPTCYCTYFPTSQTPEEGTQIPDVDAFPPAVRASWVRYVAYLLRLGLSISPWLVVLIAEAEEYNRKHPKGENMPQPSSPAVGATPRGCPPATVDPAGTPWRAPAGRVLLSDSPGVPPPSGGEGLAREDPGAEGRRTFACTFMAAGRVKMADQQQSDWLIPATAIASAQTLFDSRPCYLDHPDLFGFGWHQEPKVSRLVGVTFGAQWNPQTQSMTGYLRLYDRAEGSPGWLMGRLFDQILEDQAAGRDVPPIGLSAVFFHTSHLDEDTGLRVTDAISHIESIDIVYDPGAAGYINAKLAALSAHNLSPLSAQGEIPMSNLETQNPVSVPRTMVDSPASAPQTVGDPPASDRLDRLEAQLSRLTQAMTTLVGDQTIRGVENPAPDARVRGMLSGIDQVQIAVEALLSGVRPAGNVQPLTGVRELYTLLSGDYEMTGRFNPDRVYLANVNTSTMAGLVANALNKRVVNQYQEYPKWWEAAVTEEDFANLQQIKFITLGGIGDLPTVNEGAAYTELTWDDNTETASFIKKGGYLGITLEAIDKDDTRRLQAAPRALAQAAWLTLGKTIAALFSCNSGYGASLADSNYIFDSAYHGNLGSSAFSHASYVATKILMMKYAELNSSERLAALTKPYLLWVPVDLEDQAVAELATGEGEIGTADYHVNADALANALTDRLGRARERVICCPFWTDTNDWVCQANPMLYPGLGLGYRYGRTPEIYSVASPTAGLMFTNDTMPIKVRFFFAAGFTDYRAWYKHIVA